MTPYLYVTVPALLLGTTEQERLARVEAAQLKRLAPASPSATAKKARKQSVYCPRVPKASADVGRTFRSRRKPAWAD